MRKKKMYSMLAIIAVIAVVVIGIAFVYNIMPSKSGSEPSGSSQGASLAISPPAGCQFVKNPSDPTSQYSLTTGESTYVCDADKCYVSAVVTGDIQTGSQVYVVFTDPLDTDDVQKVYYNGQTFAATYSTGGSSSSSLSYTQFLLTNGYTLIGEKVGVSYGIRNNNKLIMVFANTNLGGIKYHYYNLVPTTWDNKVSAPPNSRCDEPYVICSGQTSYNFKMGFCPEGNTAYEYCNGQYSTINSPTAITESTESKKDPYELSRNGQISLNPQTTTGVAIVKKSIQVRKYDCTCNNAISQGTACLGGTQKCVGGCPSGYTLRTSGSEYCSNSESLPSPFTSYNPRTTVSFSSANPMCYKQYYYCVRPVFSSFSNCDKPKIIGSATCNDWGTTLGNCPTGQKCFVTATGTTGEGIGSCGCEANQCKKDTKTKLTDESYKVCEVAGNGCNDWGIERTCELGLKFNDLATTDTTAKPCICDQSATKNCDNLNVDAICLSTGTISICKEKIYGDGTKCKEYQDSVCAGQKQCLDPTNTRPDATCTCQGVNECNSISEVKCIDNIKYQTCQLDGGYGSNACYKWSTVPTSITDTTLVFCNKVTNKIETRTDVGCRIGSPGYECDPANREECGGTSTQGECICKQDSSSATSADVGTKKCSGLDLLTVKSWSGNYNTCYSWEKNNVLIPDKRETCTAGVCGCVIDENTATQSDFTNGAKRCSGTSIQQAQSFAGNCKTCYGWVDIGNLQTDKREVCFGNQCGCTNDANSATKAQFDANLKRCSGLSVQNVQKLQGSCTTCYAWTNYLPLLTDKGEICTVNTCGCKQDANSATLSDYQENKKKCVGTELQRAVENIGNCVKCYSWVKERDLNTAQGETCANAQLSCAQDANAATEAQYTSAAKRCVNNEIQKVEKFGNCYRWVFERAVKQNYECKNGVEALRGDVGCKFETAGFKCDPLARQICAGTDANTCVCKQDADTASEVEFNTNIQRCSPDLKYVQIAAKKQGTNGIDCYGWTNSLTCDIGKVCASVNGSSNCVLAYQNVGIIPKGQYAVGEEINGILVDVLKSVGTNDNLRVYGQLFDKSEQVEEVITATNTEGKAYLDFGYSFDRIASPVVSVEVGSAPNIYRANVTLSIVKGIKILLNCPAGGYIGRESTCDWDVEDSETGSLIDIAPTISVKQGENSVSYKYKGTDAIVFTPSSLGTIEVALKASKEGFINGDDKAQIEIEGLTNSVEFKFDDAPLTNDYQSGTHTLKFLTTQSGQPIDVTKLDMTIKEPSGQLVTVKFTRIGKGTYTGSYDFRQDGQTYALSGEIYFPGADVQPYSSKITILKKGTSGGTGGTGGTGGSTGGEEDYQNYYIIGGIIAAFVVLVVLSNIMRGKKRR